MASPWRWTTGYQTCQAETIFEQDGNPIWIAQGPRRSHGLAPYANASLAYLSQLRLRRAPPRAR